MIILLIRHGQSEADLLDVHEGRADFELTQKGIEQAEKMSEWVSNNYKIQKIYASTLKRAKKTADILAAKTGVQAEYRDELKEFNNGLLAGLNRKEAEEKYPEDVQLPMHRANYEMESKLEFRYRAEKFMSELLHDNDKEAVIAAVSHGGMINQLINAFAKTPAESDMVFCSGDTGIHILKYDEAGKGAARKIVRINSLEHLL